MLRNNLHYALLAVVRRWRRNLLTVLAMLAGTTTIIMLVGVSESSALNTSSESRVRDILLTQQPAKQQLKQPSTKPRYLKISYYYRRD